MAARRLPSLRKVVLDDIAVLEGVGCQFWACEGPNKRPRAMATCSLCWRIRELRRLLTKIDAEK